MFSLLISAIVPFVGYADGARIFCNAPCEVVSDSGVVFSSPTAIDAPFVIGEPVVVRRKV